jgi:hypothetical protein
LAGPLTYSVILTHLHMHKDHLSTETAITQYLEWLL